MGISSPVFGLRPGRWRLSRRSKLPNRDNFTGSLRLRLSRISAKNRATMSFASRLLRPRSSNSFSASSALVKAVMLTPQRWPPALLQKSQYSRYRVVYFFVSQCARRMLPGQPQRQTFSIRINAFAHIHVKQVELGQEFAGGTADTRKHLFNRYILSDDQGQIAAHFRELRQFMEARHANLTHSIQVHLHQIQRLTNAQLLLHTGVQRTDQTNGMPLAVCASFFNLRALSWVQSRMPNRHKAVTVVVATTGQQDFQIAFDIKEIDGCIGIRPGLRQTRTRGHKSQRRNLLQATGRWHKTQTGFKQTHARLLTLQVVVRRLHQTRP